MRALIILSAVCVSRGVVAEPGANPAREIVFRDVRSHERLLARPDPRTLGHAQGTLLWLEPRAQPGLPWAAYIGSYRLALTGCCLEPDDIEPPRQEGRTFVIEKWHGSEGPLYACRGTGKSDRRVTIEPAGDVYVAHVCGKDLRVVRSTSWPAYLDTWSQAGRPSSSLKTERPLSDARGQTKALDCASVNAMTYKRTVLVVLDGFGERPEQDANAIRMAKTPTFDALYREYPHTLVHTSGLAVGLPEGQMGNSEVGHMNLGSGRIVYQELTKIDKAISDGVFFDNATLNDAMQRCVAGSGHLHLLGLCSPGGVHSSLNHLYAIVELAKRRGVRQISIHAFLDGRDTPPKSAAGFVRTIETQLAQLGAGRIASVIGRYYAMDRDNRWDRVEQAYRLLTEGEGAHATNAVDAIEASYAAGVTDEFVKAISVRQGEPPAVIADGDACVFFNFRADRARELTRALTDPVFAHFARRKEPKLSAYVCMCQYDKQLPLPVAFPPQSLDEILGQYLSEKGIAQFRTAETEKYAHVTFFFNGGREEAFPGEERRLVPSPKEVATYDQKPEMSAVEVASGVVSAIESEKFGFVLVNFANPDMVGHTGMLPAAITAVDTIDACMRRIVDAALAHDTAVLITADHGNCEQMTDENGEPHTQHTLNPVPLLLVDPRQKGKALLDDGRLCDVAPTVLRVMGLPQPKAMEGHSLLP